MDTKKAHELVDLLIDKAPALREAGVLSLELGEMKVEMTPVYTDPGDIGGTGDWAGNVGHSDPLMDGATYPGGRVPSFPRPTTKPKTPGTNLPQELLDRLPPIPR